MVLDDEKGGCTEGQRVVSEADDCWVTGVELYMRKREQQLNEAYCREDKEEWWMMSEADA